MLFLGKLNNKGKNNGIIADQGGSKFYSTTDIWNAQSGAKLTDYLSEAIIFFMMVEIELSWYLTQMMCINKYMKVRL